MRLRRPAPGAMHALHARVLKQRTPSNLLVSTWTSAAQNVNMSSKLPAGSSALAQSWPRASPLSQCHAPASWSRLDTRRLRLDRLLPPAAMLARRRRWTAGLHPHVVFLAAFAAADSRCTGGSWLCIRLPEARCALNVSALELPSVHTLQAFIISSLFVHAVWCCCSGMNRLQQH